MQKETMKYRKTETGPEAYAIKVREDSVRNPKGEIIHGVKGIYREDNGECLGIPGRNYSTVQYPDIRDVVDNALTIGKGVDLDVVRFNSYLLPSTKCGTFSGDRFEGAMGGRCIMEWSVPSFSETDMVTGDVINYIHRVKTSHDGSWSLENETACERARCLNGWTALTTTHKSRFKHTKNLSVESIISGINRSLEVFSQSVRKYGDLFNGLNNTGISHHQGLNMIKNLSFNKQEREGIESLWATPYLWRGYDNDRAPSINGWVDARFPFKYQTINQEAWKRPNPAVSGRARVGDLFNCVTQHLSHICGNRVYAANKSSKVFNRLVAYAKDTESSEESLRLYCEAPQRERAPRGSRQQQKETLKILHENAEAMN